MVWKTKIHQMIVWLFGLKKKKKKKKETTKKCGFNVLHEK